MLFRKAKLVEVVVHRYYWIGLDTVLEGGSWKDGFNELSRNTDRVVRVVIELPVEGTDDGGVEVGCGIEDMGVTPNKNPPPPIFAVDDLVALILFGQTLLELHRSRILRGFIAPWLNIQRSFSSLNTIVSDIGSRDCVVRFLRIDLFVMSGLFIRSGLC